MFGFFKAKTFSADVEPTAADSDVPEIRNPNIRGSQLTEHDHQTMRDYPFVADFMRAHPLTRLDTDQLANFHITAKYEIQEADLFDNRADDGTAADRINARAWELALYEHDLEVAIRADELIQRRQDDEDELLTDIRDAIEGNNLVNMAGNFVSAHPIIAGFMGGMVMDRLNQK